MRPATSVVPPYTSRVVDSLFVGETENIGNPRTPAEMAYGRSLPEPEVADFPIRGYEFYDYHHELDNDTFVNYQDNATRKTGAISYLLFTSFGMSSNNTVQRAKFINAKPVYFPPMEYKWSNDDYGNGSYKTSVFHDKDGSVSGVPNSYIVINGGIARRRSLRGQAHLERCGVQGRHRADDYWRRRGRWWRSWRRSWCAVRGGAGGRGGAPVPLPRPEVAGGAPVPLPQEPEVAAPVVGARLGRIGDAPAQPLAVLSRNGKEFPVTGATNVRAGTEYKVTTERPSLSLSVTELDAGSWVMFELPGFTTAASGTAQDSLDALRKASATSYYKGNGSLWVKLVSTGDVLGSGPDSGPSGGASLQVSGGAPGAAPAGAGGRGPGIVVGARLGRLGGAPAQPLAVLSRNGKEFPVTGATNVRAGSEIKVTTERPSLSLSVTELDKGSWVIFELPGFTTAASGAPQDSLDALRKASDTSYYKGNGTLWVKLVSSGDILGSGPDSGPSGGASLNVSRDAAAVTAAAR